MMLEEDVKMDLENLVKKTYNQQPLSLAGLEPTGNEFSDLLPLLVKRKINN